MQRPLAYLPWIPKGLRSTTLYYSLGAEMLKTSSMVRMRLRFCPACIQEDLKREVGIYQRLEWQVEAVRTCSTHHCLLVEARCETKYGSVWDSAAQSCQYRGIEVHFIVESQTAVFSTCSSIPKIK